MLALVKNTEFAGIQLIFKSLLDFFKTRAMSLASYVFYIPAVC